MLKLIFGRKGNNNSCKTGIKQHKKKELDKLEPT